MNQSESSNVRHLVLPEEIVRNLDLKKDQTIVVVERSDGLVMKTTRPQNKTVPIKAVGIAAGVTLVSLLFIFKGYQQIPFTGDRSLATITILFGVVTGMISFTGALIRHRRSNDHALSNKMSWRSVPVVVVSFMLALSVGLLFAFKMLGHLFYGASFDIYTSAVIASVVVGVVNYIMIAVATSLTPITLIRMLIGIIVGGVMIAMITNREEQWWLANFSFLGTHEATRAWEFNLTLMVSALLMMALIDYLFELLYDIYGRLKGLIILKILLLLTALCLGGVGFFPHNENLFNQAMHNRVAGYLVYLFIILIVSIRWLVPDVPKEFLRYSYVIGGILGVSVFLFLGVWYLSLTAFELIAFILAFSWLLMLLQILIDKVMYHDKVHTLTLK